MRVVVIGAGIGGLALAQGLRRAGAQVRVYDRDRAVADTGGYRLHLDEAACAALRRLLSPAHFQALRASSASPTAYRQFTVADHRIRPLLVDAQDPDAERLLIGRIPLRRLLAYGLDDVLRFGVEFTRHTENADGTVTAHFADGSTADADLLVGADGVGSRVATALAGRPTSTPVGVSGIAGRTPLDDRNRASVPAPLHTGPVLAFGPGGIGLFLTVHEPTGDATSAGDAVDGWVPDGAAPAGGSAPGGVAPADRVAPGGVAGAPVPVAAEAPTFIWGLIAGDRRLPVGLRDREPAALPRVADELLDGWSPQVRSLVCASEPGATSYFRFHAADPAADLTPWRSGRVTALGDAVHAMPPTGGQGAATAIRDADLLATTLAGVLAGDATLPAALREYQVAMAGYAADAVRESLAPLGWMRTMGTAGGTLAARVGLPVAATVAAGYRVIRGRGRSVTDPAATTGR
jgi:2-polyprenyl-6-methoxyphenol hydroxylase-like FAD-dependent oxidoreductase